MQQPNNDLSLNSFAAEKISPRRKSHSISSFTSNTPQTQSPHMQPTSSPKLVVVRSSYAHHHHHTQAPAPQRPGQGSPRGISPPLPRTTSPILRQVHHDEGEQEFSLEHEWVLWHDGGCVKGQTRTQYESTVRDLGSFSTVQVFQSTSFVGPTFVIGVLAVLEPCVRRPQVFGGYQSTYIQKWDQTHMGRSCKLLRWQVGILSLYCLPLTSRVDNTIPKTRHWLVDNKCGVGNDWRAAPLFTRNCTYYPSSRVYFVQCGIVISIRPGNDLVFIWNSKSDPAIISATTEKLMQILPGDRSWSIKYQAHKAGRYVFVC